MRFFFSSKNDKRDYRETKLRRRRRDRGFELERGRRWRGGRRFGVARAIPLPKRYWSAVVWLRRRRRRSCVRVRDGCCRHTARAESHSPRAISWYHACGGAGTKNSLYFAFIKRGARACAPMCVFVQYMCSVWGIGGFFFFFFIEVFRHLGFIVGDRKKKNKKKKPIDFWFSRVTSFDSTTRNSVVNGWLKTDGFKNESVKVFFFWKVNSGKSK